MPTFPASYFHMAMKPTLQSLITFQQKVFFTALKLAGHSTSYIPFLAGARRTSMIPASSCVLELVLIANKKARYLIFSMQWSHHIRMMFQPFSFSIIQSNPKKSFHHGLQTCEQTPIHTSLTWRVTPLFLFPCTLFMENCPSHSHSSCLSNSSDVQLLRFCF